MRRKLAELKKGDLPICKFYEPYHPALKTQCGHTMLAFNKSAFTFVQKMKQTAANFKLVYLTSTQVYSRDSIFVIKKDFKDHKWIDESYTNPQTYRGYINPQIDQQSGEKVDVWERCMSMPYIESRVKRSPELKVSYVNEKRQNISEQIVGFKAYVYQHCMEHVKGKCLLDWNSCRGFLRVYAEAEDLFPKTKFVLKDYSLRIRDSIQKRKNQQEQIIMTDQEKQLQKREEEILRKVLQEQINIVTQKYGK